MDSDLRKFFPSRVSEFFQRRYVAELKIGLISDWILAIYVQNESLQKFSAKSEHTKISYELKYEGVLDFSVRKRTLFKSLFVMPSCLKAKEDRMKIGRKVVKEVQIFFGYLKLSLRVCFRSVSMNVRRASADGPIETQITENVHYNMRIQNIESSFRYFDEFASQIFSKEEVSTSILTLQNVRINFEMKYLRIPCVAKIK